MRRSAAIFASVLFASTVGVAPAGSEKLGSQIRDKQGDLDRLQKTIYRKKSEKEETVAREKQLADEVERLSHQLDSSKRTLRDVSWRLIVTEKKRKATEERLWASNLELGQWSEMLAKELNLYYVRKLESGVGAYMELAYRQAALQDKTGGLAFARQQHAQVEGLRDEFLSIEVELQKLRLQKEHQQKRVESAQKGMHHLYKTVQGRRAILERDIQKLQSSAGQLQKMIQTLIRREEESRAKAGRSKQSVSQQQAAAQKKRGHLPWPVQGEVVERFGRLHHPELDTYVFSNGIKLRPAEASPIRAIQSGEVLYAGLFMSYGLMALVQHADNLYSVYAHLGQLNASQGQKLSEGEILGNAGEDDSGRPMVYFELRVAGTPVDPLLWLK